MNSSANFEGGFTIETVSGALSVGGSAISDEGNKKEDAQEGGKENYFKEDKDSEPFKMTVRRSPKEVLISLKVTMVQLELV